MTIAGWVVVGIVLSAGLFWVNAKVTKSFSQMNVVSNLAISIVFIIIIAQMLYMYNGIRDPLLNIDNKIGFTLEALGGIVTLLGLYHVLIQNRMVQKQSETLKEIKKLRNAIFLLEEELNRCPERAKHHENLHLIKYKN